MLVQKPRDGENERVNSNAMDSDTESAAWFLFICSCCLCHRYCFSFCSCLSVVLRTAIVFLIFSSPGNNFKQYLEVDNRIVKSQIHNSGWYDFGPLQESQNDNFPLRNHVSI